MLIKAQNTVERLYNAVQYNIKLHTELQDLVQSTNQTLNKRASYGVPTVKLLEKLTMF